MALLAKLRTTSSSNESKLFRDIVVIWLLYRNNFNQFAAKFYHIAVKIIHDVLESYYLEIISEPVN